jgi:hypothetical protein
MFDCHRRLLGNIPRLVTKAGDAISVTEFYESIYNFNPAHADDVHAAIIASPDHEVITPTGGERRKANTVNRHCSETPPKPKATH